MKRKRSRRQTSRREPPTDYMMKRMMDMNTIAVGGMVTVGTLGVVGSILKP
jgi:hypothetical protein